MGSYKSSTYTKRWQFYSKALLYFLTLVLLLKSGISEAGTPSTPLLAPVRKIEIIKSARLMRVYHGKSLKQLEVKEYQVALGKNPLGPKRKQGDFKTPEGHYFIDSKNPHSDYFLSLGISYPNAHDKRQAEKLGVSPGNLIRIHGVRDPLGDLNSKEPMKDWTQGCIALNNYEIAEIYLHTAIGTPIIIKP